jgi:hypothetical protein
MLGNTAATRTEHAQRMGVVDHQPGPVTLLELDQPMQVQNIAFGRIAPLDDYQCVAMGRTGPAQDALEGIQVVVPEVQACGPREPTIALLCTNSSSTMRSSSPTTVLIVEILAACPLTNANALSTPLNSAISVSNA